MSLQTLRQCLVAFGLSVCGISEGFIVGQMSGMLDALSSNKTDIMLTDDELSWMASSDNILCVIGLGIMGIITEMLGRRMSIVISSLPITACWVLIYCAGNKTQLFIARFLQGVCYGGILLMIFTGVAEYQPPKIRALSLTLTSNVASLVGTTLGHILSILLNWRHVAIIGVIPSMISMILPLFWVESPTWLAAKGRFKDCENAFHALRSPSEASARELQLLLASEKTKHINMMMKEPKVILGKKILIAIKQTYFWKLIWFSFVLFTYRGTSGRILFNTLAITILHNITGTSDILFFTFVVDVLSIFGAVISCFLLKKFKIRPLFLISGITSNAVLVLLGFCLYLFPSNDLNLSWIKVSLLSLYFVIIMSGPCPVLDTIMAEMCPIEIKSFFLTVTAIMGGCVQFLSIKLVLDSVPVMGYHGVFFVNASITFLCILYMWFYMPETKGRSLSEIEYYFKNNYTFNYCEKFNDSETKEIMSVRKKNQTNEIKSL